MNIKTIFTGITLLGYTLLLSCSNEVVSNKNEDISSSEIQTIFGNFLNKSKLLRNSHYQDSLDNLSDLGIYTFDFDDFLACERDNLQSYYLRRQLPSEIVKVIKNKINGMTGDKVFDFLLLVAAMSSEELTEEFKVLNMEDSQYDSIDEFQDNIVTHLIWLASKRGSVEALNEIGAAQIYCYQDTEQDVEAAITALQKAADKGDNLSMLTLGKIYYTGLGGFNDRELGKSLQDQAFELTINKLRDARMNIERFAESESEIKIK